MFNGREIPGTDRVICIFGSCHDRPWGALAIVNRNKGIDSEEAIEKIWPGIARERISIDGSNLPGSFMPDYLLPVRFRYEDPFPLIDTKTGIGGKYFLVSRNINFTSSEKEIRSTNDLNTLVLGIFLVDTFGNEILLHTEQPGCFDPMPLTAYSRPPSIPEQRNFTSLTGTMYVTNVYEGTHLQGLKHGDAAYLRVVESTEKRFWTWPLWRCVQYAKKLVNGQWTFGNTYNRPAVSWAGFETKRILGTVPVEPDGSAYFEMPAEKFAYFQLLDSNGMMIASMRSGTMVQPGETRGCAGCHENRLSAPDFQKSYMAFKRSPSKMDGWYGPARNFCYMTEVQPVWDKYCVSCHDFGNKAGERLLLARDKELVFNVSYAELFQNWGGDNALLNTVGLGLAPINSAYAIGSHRSRLVELLKKGHQDVVLLDEEMKRIITWIDIGGPYYPNFASAHPNNFAGRSPLSIPDVQRLEELTGIVFANKNGNISYAFHKPWISFDRPELSPCLQKLDKNSDTYHEALSIIIKGQLEFQNNPEADMPGFKYCKEHQEREEKYNRLLCREHIRRKALAEGRKVYDHELNEIHKGTSSGNK